MTGPFAAESRRSLDTSVWEAIIHASETDDPGTPVKFGADTGVWSDDPFLATVHRIGSDFRVNVSDGGTLRIDQVSDPQGLVAGLRITRLGGRLTVKAQLRPLDALGFDHAFAHVLDAHWDQINDALTDRYGATLHRTGSWMRTVLIIGVDGFTAEDDGTATTFRVSDAVEAAWMPGSKRERLISAIRSGSIVSEIWAIARGGY
ncbi:hypothetical protein [Agromyces humi]|uniref:hypothetical protein n=1 Tax=Agromyces humi TaxID=1766800 RepID=UPI001358696B|nr:hypothetical protein [Agromyces humi]